MLAVASSLPNPLPPFHAPPSDSCRLPPKAVLPWSEGMARRFFDKKVAGIRRGVQEVHAFLHKVPRSAPEGWWCVPPPVDALAAAADQKASPMKSRPKANRPRPPPAAPAPAAAPPGAVAAAATALATRSPERKRKPTAVVEFLMETAATISPQTEVSPNALHSTGAAASGSSKRKARRKTQAPDDVVPQVMVAILDEIAGPLPCDAAAAVIAGAELAAHGLSPRGAVKRSAGAIGTVTTSLASSRKAESQRDMLRTLWVRLKLLLPQLVKQPAPTTTAELLHLVKKYAGAGIPEEKLVRNCCHGAPFLSACSHS